MDMGGDVLEDITKLGDVTILAPSNEAWDAMNVKNVIRWVKNREFSYLFDVGGEQSRPRWIGTNTKLLLQKPSASPWNIEHARYQRQTQHRENSNEEHESGRIIDEKHYLFIYDNDSCFVDCPSTNCQRQAIPLFQREKWKWCRNNNCRRWRSECHNHSIGHCPNKRFRSYHRQGFGCAIHNCIGKIANRPNVEVSLLFMLPNWLSKVVFLLFLLVFFGRLVCWLMLVLLFFFFSFYRIPYLVPSIVNLGGNFHQFGVIYK